MVKALKIEPDKAPEETTLGTSLTQLQEAVGGMIEIVPLSQTCSILCNETGKLDGLTPNRVWGSDVITGTFYIIHTDDNGEIADLSDEDSALYKEMFRKPLTQRERACYDRVLSLFYRE